MITDPYYRLEFEERRRKALIRECPDCGAPVGQECRNQYSGERLKRWPAHIRRERP